MSTLEESQTRQQLTRQKQQNRQRQLLTLAELGGVTLCGGHVGRLRLGAHDNNVVFGMSATSNSSIVKSITCTCADSVGAVPNKIAVGAVHQASAITVGVVAVDTA